MSTAYKHDYSDRFDKLYRKVHSAVFKTNEPKPEMNIFYGSYWHSKFFSKPRSKKRQDHYYTQYPNRGAGFGHGFGIWLNGVENARGLGMKYAYVPLVSEGWESVLGLAKGQERIEDLQKRGYKKVKLPYFKHDDKKSINVARRIIDSYNGQKVVFIGSFEQDTIDFDLCSTVEYLRGYFFSADSRANDHLLYSSDAVNIGVHIRRGDVAEMHMNHDEKNEFRWLELSYYKNLLNQMKDHFRPEQKIRVYIFSEGKKDEFLELEDPAYEMVYCLDMNAEDSFVHMCFADILVTGMSAFSYYPGLICKGKKITPKKFWLRIPQNGEWICADMEGNLDSEALGSLFDQE